MNILPLIALIFAIHHGLVLHGSKISILVQLLTVFLAKMISKLKFSKMDLLKLPSLSMKIS